MISMIKHFDTFTANTLSDKNHEAQIMLNVKFLTLHTFSKIKTNFEHTATPGWLRNDTDHMFQCQSWIPTK